MLANDFIFGGILDRFPQLKVICSEFELSWVPGFMARLDQTEAVAPRLKIPRLKMKAGDYMRERIWHGFIDDTAASFCIPYIGASRVLWSSDFPHVRSIGLDADSAVYGLIAACRRTSKRWWSAAMRPRSFTCSGDEPGRTSTRGRLPFFCWYGTDEACMLAAITRLMSQRIIGVPSWQICINKWATAPGRSALATGPLSRWSISKPPLPIHNTPWVGVPWCYGPWRTRPACSPWHAATTSLLPVATRPTPASVIRRGKIPPSSSSFVMAIPVLSWTPDL